MEVDESTEAPVDIENQKPNETDTLLDTENQKSSEKEALFVTENLKSDETEIPLDTENLLGISTPEVNISEIDPMTATETGEPATDPISTTETNIPTIDPISTTETNTPVTTTETNIPAADPISQEAIAPSDTAVGSAAEDNIQLLHSTSELAVPPVDMLEPSEAQEQMDVSEDSTAQLVNSATEDLPQNEEQTPMEQNEQPVVAASDKQASDFTLGVPGLSFSANNVKTANDGTKMVQIHQSQITPEQLVALQNNPNIKVVFRHVPSGRSYTKPPRHLLPPGYSEPIRKRKAVYSEKELEADDVYSFDEGIDTSVPTKMMKTNDNRARYNYGGSSKIKRGRPRVLPDASTYSSSYIKPLKQSNLPAKVILTDLLTRINNPNAKKEIKLHTSQINAEVLANMDLNPIYKIVLTTKQELPPLVIEDVSAEEKERLEKEAERVRKEEEEKTKAEPEVEEKEQETSKEEEESKVEETIEEDTTTTNQKEEEEKEQERIAEEKEKERKRKEAEREQKLKEEEEELMKSVMQQPPSRSGRIRKPSRFSLDIARLTKRKSVGVSESSAEDSEQEPPKDSTPKSAKKTPSRKSKTAKDSEPDPSPSRKSKAAKEPEPEPEPSPKRSTRSSRRSVDLKMDDKTKDSDKDDKNNKKGKKVDTPKKGKKSNKSKEESESEKEEKDKDETKEPEVTPKKGKKSNKKSEESEKEEKEKEETKEPEEKSEEKAEKATDKEEKTADKMEQEATESEKEVTSTENTESDKNEKTSKVSEASEVKKESEITAVEPDTSTDAGKTTTEQEKKSDSQSMEVDEPLDLKIEEEEEEEIIDNRYRLRKLLEQCSAEEIKSVMLPEAFQSINMGDFLLYKSGQMHNDSGKISFPQLYKQFESLHKSATKEATRYNTLVRRANKVGGDKRMEKIVLMPVYNMNAANSLEISNSSIDAHICGIQKTMTTQMIAANSFFIKSKMDSPKIRLRLPEATAPKPVKQKQRRPLFTNHHQQRYVTNQRQIEPDSTTPDKPNKTSHYVRKSYNYTNGIQPRKINYLEQKTAQISSTEQNHLDSTTSSTENTFQTIPVDSTSILKADAQTLQISSASSVLEQLQATVNAHQQSIVSTTENSTHAPSEPISLNPSTGELATSANDTAVTTAASDTTTAQTEQYFVAEDGVPVSEASTTEATSEEAGKQLVPLGDGQYVELPEGYSLIQTDEGYIIGQPGSTFTQGEDGNVYVTNSDGTTSEITQEDVAAGGGDAVNVIDQLAEG